MTLPCHGALAVSAVPGLDLLPWDCQGRGLPPAARSSPVAGVGGGRWWGVGLAGAVATAAAWAERGPAQQAGAGGPAGRLQVGAIEFRHHPAAGAGACARAAAVQL